MVLIETSHFKNFSEYLNSLDKTGKKNYKYAKKHNAKVSYDVSAFRKDWIQQWMDLWSQQLIRGEQRQWAFDASALVDKNVLVFEAIEDGKTIAMQFVDVSDNYMNCHPVMYEKEKYAQRYLSKFMWFNLIRWAIESGIQIVDLGGGIDENWREMIKRRQEFPNPRYKWLYVPKSVKEHPDKQQNYKVEHYGISKRISKID